MTYILWIQQLINNTMMHICSYTETTSLLILP